VAAVDAHNVGRYRIRQITVGQKPVVVVEVSRREDGFAQTSDGRILVRRGPRNQALIGDEVWRLASSRTLRRFERSPAGVRRDQIDDELLLASPRKSVALSTRNCFPRCEMEPPWGIEPRTCSLRERPDNAYYGV
jgi:hypothetical protein